MRICQDCGYPYDADEQLKYGDEVACPQCGCEDSEEYDEDKGRER